MTNKQTLVFCAEQMLMAIQLRLNERDVRGASSLFKRVREIVEYLEKMK